MRHRWLARRLIATVLAAAPGACASSPKPELHQPPPPPPAPTEIADARHFQFDGTTWSERLPDGTVRALAEFPPVLRVGSRPPSEVDPSQPLPAGVLIPGRVAGDRMAAPSTPEEQALAQVYASGYWGDVLVRPLATGFLVTVVQQADFCSDGWVVAFVVIDGAAPVAVGQEHLPAPECQHPRGRRPPGLSSRAPAQDDAIARFLAEAAHLEAASVPAFERLAGELAALGAPAALVAAARRAAADEVRHADAMHALGAAATPVELAAVPPRDAAAIALDNAVEGCVHEAFAAVLCAWQAAHAADPAIAAAMAPIADDECAHADLAGAIAAWLEPRLSPAARDAIDAAVGRALDALPEVAAREATRAAPAAAALGLPDPAAARALAAAFAEHLRYARTRRWTRTPASSTSTRPTTSRWRSSRSRPKPS